MKNYLFIGMLAMVAGFTSCKKSPDNGTNMTQVNVRITDAPGAYDALYLNVKEVQVLTTGETSTFAVNSNFDILRYRMGRDTLIASQVIPAGTIQEIRLVLNSTGNRVVVNGVSYDLTTPSGQTSGIKLKVHDDLVAGIGYTMLLDFDAAKSIVLTGNGKYILKPVIRAIPQAVTGALAGTVSPAISNPQVYAIQGTDSIGTVTDATGRFYFMGLAAGTYRVAVKPIAPYKAVDIDNVVVTTGSVKDMGTISVNQ